MKSIMITGANSGSGKTWVAIALARALKNRNYKVIPFKAGPDYIDPRFLESASGNLAWNLDIHLQGEEGVKRQYEHPEGDVRLIEGVMGYYDGIYNTYENSSFDLSKKLNCPAILVYTPQGEMFTAITKIKGMVDFSQSKLVGVIFNKTSESYYRLLKEQVEKYIGITVLGFIPKIENTTLESRHLGLVQSVEIEELNEKIDTMAEALEKTVSIDRLLEVAENKNKAESESQTPLTPETREKSYINNISRYKDIRVAIAKDQAFSFYYNWNLKLLDELCRVIYFSPIKDAVLPECDLIYLGGGYPEVFKKELEANETMRQQIKAFGESGGYIFGECGGMMYLTEEIEGHQMVGLIKGKSYMTERLQRFGYIDVTLNKDCLLGKKGERFTAHEFHRSYVDSTHDTCLDIKKTQGTRHWACGYQYKNVFGAYPHIHFQGHRNLVYNLLNQVKGGHHVYQESE